MPGQNLADIVREELDELSESYLGHAIGYITWTSTFTLAALAWIGSNIRGTYGDIRFLMGLSILCLSISFLAAGSVFFLIIFSQSAAIVRKIFHLGFLRAGEYITPHQRSLRDQLITDIGKPHQFYEILVFQGLLAAHFVFLVIALLLFIRAMVIQ
jgi:hypothetical protein